MNYIFIVSINEKCRFSINKLLLPTTSGEAQKKVTFVLFYFSATEKIKIKNNSNMLRDFSVHSDVHLNKYYTDLSPKFTYKICKICELITYMLIFI